MQLLVLRHEVAEPREGRRDSDADAKRALTDKGRKRAERAARALARIAGPIDVVASSSLRRASETAEFLARELPDAELEEIPALAPGAGPEAVVEWLRGLRGAEGVAIVGHEPDLSQLVTWLVAGLSTPILSLGKGGAALLELPDRIAPGQARLLWLLRPEQLRRLR
jgi:phosphohistidine phosphatase